MDRPTEHPPTGGNGKDPSDTLSLDAIREGIEVLADIEDPVEYELQRNRLAAQTGLSRSALERLTAPRRKLIAEEEQETSLFPTVTPWNERIDPTTLLHELRSFFSAHMAMHDAQVIAVALWALHAWTHDEAEVSPILGIQSPEKRCGKTTLLNCLKQVVPRPLSTANVTSAALFRVIEQSTPTLLIDEADTFLRGNHELRGVLNSGHARMSAQLIRCVGKDHAVQTFKTWAPKAIASIGRLPETLLDRSILLRLQRKLVADPVERLSNVPEAVLDRLRRKCAKFREQCGPTLDQHAPNFPADINDRAVDNWRPLLQIAYACCSEDLALEALAYIEEHNAEDDRDAVGTRALADLRLLFSSTGEDGLPTTKILEYLVDLDERPWADYLGGRPLSAQQLARLLKPYGVRPRQIKRNHTNFRGYRRDELEDSFQRYLPPPDKDATPLPPADSHASWVADYDAAAAREGADATPERPNDN